MSTRNQMRRRSAFVGSNSDVATPATNVAFRRSTATLSSSGRGSGHLGSTPFAQRYFSRDVGTQRRDRSPNSASRRRSSLLGSSKWRDWAISGRRSSLASIEYSPPSSGFGLLRSEKDEERSVMRTIGMILAQLALSLTLLVLCHRVDSWSIALIMYAGGCISGVSCLLMVFKLVSNGARILLFGNKKHDRLEDEDWSSDIDSDDMDIVADRDAFARLRGKHTRLKTQRKKPKVSPRTILPRRMKIGRSGSPKQRKVNPAVIAAEERHRRKEMRLDRYARNYVERWNRKSELNDSADKPRGQRRVGFHGIPVSGAAFGSSSKAGSSGSSLSKMYGQRDSPERRRLYDQSKLDDRWNESGHYFRVPQVSGSKRSTTSTIGGSVAQSTPISSLLRSTTAFTPATVAAAHASSSASPTTFKMPQRRRRSPRNSTSLIKPLDPNLPFSPFSRRKEIEQLRMQSKQGGFANSDWISNGDGLSAMGSGGTGHGAGKPNLNLEVSSASHSLIKSLGLDSMIHHWSHNARQWIHNEMAGLLTQVKKTDQQVWDCIDQLKEWYPRMKSQFESLRTVQERLQIFLSNFEAVKKAAEQKNSVHLMNVWQKRAYLNRALRHIMGETREVKHESEEWAIDTAFECLKKVEKMFGDSTWLQSSSLVGWKRDSAIVMNAVKQRLDDFLCPAAVFSEEYFLVVDSEDCLSQSSRLRQQLVQWQKFKGIAICAINESVTGTLDVPYYFLAFESALTSDTGMIAAGGYTAAAFDGMIGSSSLGRGGSIDVWLPVPGERNVYQSVALFAAFVRRFLQGKLAGKDLAEQTGMFQQILQH